VMLANSTAAHHPMQPTRRAGMHSLHMVVSADAGLGRRPNLRPFQSNHLSHNSTPPTPSTNPHYLHLHYRTTTPHHHTTQQLPFATTTSTPCLLIQ
jgi:hypothetical protein